MKRFLLLLLPAALFAGQPRFARLGEFSGSVEVQLHPADAWIAAERNLTLTENTWLRTGPASRAEIELDEGSAWRLGPDSLLEISDYSLLSTGQRLTVLSLDHGLAYFTGEPFGRDSLLLVVPGAQVTLIRGARVRLEAGAVESRVSVVEGVVRLSCPAAEIDLREGNTVRVQPAVSESFSLDRSVAAVDLDRWSEERDKILAGPASAIRVVQRFGLADLDASGDWLQTDIGAVWKPKAADGWAPFQLGRWRWYDGLGYTWVSDDSWGWLPYHYGRWLRKADLGWVWKPSASPAFKPGDVYWLYGMRIAGWGPLAPGENWSASISPQQYLAANTTWAAFPPDAAILDPSGFTGRPLEPLAVSVFRPALPSPAFLSSRLEVKRPLLRVGTTHFTPVLAGTTFQDVNDVPPPDAPPVPPPVSTGPPSADAPPPGAGYPPDPGPPGPPMSTTYPVPVYTGIIVVNPPDHPPYSRTNPNNPQSGQKPPVTPAVTPPTSPPPTQSQPRVVIQPESRPGTPPRMTPVENRRPDPPRQVNSEPKPAPAPAPVSAPPAASRPAPPPPAPTAPKIEAPKADAASKTDTSAKKQ